MPSVKILALGRVAGRSLLFQYPILTTTRNFRLHGTPDSAERTVVARYEYLPTYQHSLTFAIGDQTREGEVGVDPEEQ